MKSIRLFSVALLLSSTLLGVTNVFASEPMAPNPSVEETPINAELTLNQNPTDPTPPTGSEGGTDESTGIDSLFGIAYAPGALSGRQKLEEQGTTTLNLVANGENVQNKHNVGVQDKTRAKDRNWHLTAQLEWTNDLQGYLDGATITATDGNLKMNDGKGNLSELTEGEVSMGLHAGIITISKNAPVEVMKANVGKTVNGVYNYQFTNPQLVIPNSEQVAAGSYSGNIVWNLTDALGGEQRTVTVKYVSSETGQEVHPAKTISGNQGEMYDVSTSEYKLDLTNQRCTLDMSRLPSNATGSFDSNPVVTYYYNVASLEVTNGGFENPVINAPTLCENVYYAQGYTSNQVPGWTGVNNRIELVKKLSDSNLHGAAYEGNQSGELNTSRYDSYYQDFDTIPGETIY